MADGDFSRDDARTSPRFVPKNHLKMFLAGSSAPLVHGDIKDLSELGACVRTDTALESGCVVTLNVKNGYSFLFRAEGRIVWRARERRPQESFDCTHGISFTGLSPFTRKLIRRLGDIRPRPEPPSANAPVEGVIWDSDSDPDLQILFRAERAPAEVDEVGALADPVREVPRLPEQQLTVSIPGLAGPPDGRPRDPHLDVPVVDEDIDWRPATETPLAPNLAAARAQHPPDEDAELSGNLGYFDIADVLQMLEASGATGVLYIHGNVAGEIHLLEGRICRCVSEELTDEESAFHLVVAREGRFHFVPCPVPESARRIGTTTQLLLEAQLRRDRHP